MTVTAQLVHETLARLTAPGAPFEVTEREVGGVAYRAYTHAAATLPEVLALGRTHGDNDFLVFDGQRWSFNRYFAAVDALAAALQHDHKIVAGDRIAIAMRNCPEWLIVFAAAAQAGAVVVPINSWGSAEELQFTLKNSGAVLLAADAPRLKLAAGMLAETKVAVLLSEVDGPLTGLDTTDGEIDLQTISDAVQANLDRAYTPATPAPEDTALLLYTSGSTGHPKGVIYRHVAVGQALMNMMLVGFVAVELGGEVGLRGNAVAEAQLLTVPLFHATGLFGGFLVPCAVGHKVALLRKWDAPTAMRVIEAESITMISSVPAILKDLLTHPELDSHDVSSVSRIAAAGAATPADLPGLISDKLGIVARSSGYAMTETAAVGATMSGPVFDLKPLASGTLSPIIDLRVVDAEGTVVRSTQDGEIQMHGITVSPGYWQLDEITCTSYTHDGWIRTGDLGHVDADGFVHITGRIKELVIRGGENISPIEIENVAYRHPDVKEAAVFGVPDDAMGEELAMVFFPQPASRLTEEDLRRHLMATLPAFKVPKFIVASPEPLPRNASEKIHRLALSRSFVAG